MSSMSWFLDKCGKCLSVVHREVFVGLGICGFLLGLLLLHEDLEEVFFHCQADEKQPIQRFSDSRFTERPYPRDGREP